jgi:transposase InsO family protein
MSAMRGGRENGGWKMHTHNENDELALARYAVIAPLVCRSWTKEEFNAEVRRITLVRHIFPGGVLKCVSTRNVRRWVKWYKEGRKLTDEREITAGVDALRAVIRKDNGVPEKLSPELIGRAIRLREEEPTRTTATLVKLLKAEALGRGEAEPEVKENTLARHLRARGATRKRLKQDGRVYPRFEHAHRNDLWQGDMTGGLWLPNPLEPVKPRQCFLHAIIDDHTRYVPHAQFYFRQNLTCLLDGFRKAVHAGGVCSMLFVDNGPAYQHQQLNRMASRLGIDVVYATPYHPQGKGKIERFFGHVKTSFYPEARRAGIQSIEELNEFWWAWLEQYHEREHSELKTTPRARWEAEGSQARWPEPMQLVEAFLWEEKRIVDRTGCVKLEDNAYPVPEHLVGETVSLRFDPFDLSRVRVFHNGAYVDTVAPYEVASNTFRKALPRRPEKPVPLESSTAYRAQMTREFRQRLRRAVDSSDLRDPGTDCLTRVEFAEVLAQCLAGRVFTAAEGHAVADFFVRYAPLQKHLVEIALRMAVEEKGSRRHLRFYLDAVRDARSGKGVA